MISVQAAKSKKCNMGHSNFLKIARRSMIFKSQTLRIIFAKTALMDHFCLHIISQGFPSLLAEEACLQWQALVEVPSPQGPTRSARHSLMREFSE